MHDSEPDTFTQISKREEFCGLLEKIGVQAEVKQIDSDEIEKGHFAPKKVVGVQWVGGTIAETLNSDAELTSMIVKLPYKDAKIWIEPTRNGIRIHGSWKSSYEFRIDKELFAVYDKIASHVKSTLGFPPV